MLRPWTYLVVGQLGRAIGGGGHWPTYAAWMCLNKYAKFATFVAQHFRQLFFSRLGSVLPWPEAQDLFFRHFVDSFVLDNCEKVSGLVHYQVLRVRFVA